MTLADSLQAKKPITLRRYSTYAGKKKSQHQFVGSLMVPKKFDDGRYPVVDVWTWSMDEVVLTPWQAEPVKFPPTFIGASELNRSIMVKGKRLLHIDTVRGVEPTGYGFGFALYAASALAAKFAGPDGIFSVQRDRSIDASELWKRLKTISFGPMQGPLGKEAPYWLHEGSSVRETSFMNGGIDYILGQSVLDSGLVVRVGHKLYDRKPWASFRAPPTTNFAYDMKYRTKKLDAWEKAMVRLDTTTMANHP